MEPRNRFQGMNSASLCSLAGRYDNPIPTRSLAPIDCLKIPVQTYMDDAVYAVLFTFLKIQNTILYDWYQWYDNLCKTVHQKWAGDNKKALRGWCETEFAVLYPRLWIEETNDLVDFETEISRNLKGLVAIEIATAVRKKSLAAVTTEIWFFETPPPRTRARSLIANR